MSVEIPSDALLPRDFYASNCPGFKLWAVHDHHGYTFTDLVSADNADNARYKASVRWGGSSVDFEVTCLGDNPAAVEWSRVRGI